MRIIITDHARARILERVGCRPDKVEKMVFKAWKFGTDPLMWFLERRERNKHHDLTIYKVFMGTAFVFVPECQERTKLILTTCLHYDHRFKPVLPQLNSPPLLDDETPLPEKRLKQATGE